MNRKQPLLLALFSGFALVLAACIAPISETASNQDLLFQTSTLDALVAGVFDGEMTVAELKQHGDFGLGTYNALDGEMIVVDGEVYQVRDDGVAVIADDTLQIPFATVNFFEPQERFDVSDAMDCAALQTYIDTQLPSLNTPYAIKVSGTFDYLKVRAPKMQREPYPPLADALAEQVIFESEDVAGSIVGYRLPPYLATVNLAGYHFHFLTDDLQAGGHVLDCSGGEATTLTVEIDPLGRYYLDVPENAEFLAAPLTDTGAE